MKFLQSDQKWGNYVVTIYENVGLPDKNWFKTGGSARFYVEPGTLADVQQAIFYAQERSLCWFILGEGANILISDEGFDGLVIRIKNTEVVFDVQGGLITAGAGVSMSDLITVALDSGLTGLEEFSGIPGSVGGSVFINIHYFEFLLSHFLVGATVINLETGQVCSVDNEWFKFGYNESTLQHEPWVLFDATFKLCKASELDVAYARGRSHEIIRHRNRRYPAARTCGSFFRNFLPGEVSFEIAGKKIPFVAYYLEKVGVKGSLKVGGAMVYPLHANMLVTTEGATSTDVINLVREMQTRVKKEFGIVPQPECRLVGFKEYPLLV